MGVLVEIDISDLVWDDQTERLMDELDEFVKKNAK